MTELSMPQVPTLLVFQSTNKEGCLFDDESETLYDAPWVYPNDFKSEGSYDEDDDSEVTVEEIREVKTTEPIVFDGDTIGQAPWLEDYSPYKDGKTGVTMGELVKKGLMAEPLDSDPSERSSTSWHGFIMEKMANKCIMARPVKTLKDHSERSATSCTQDLTMNEYSSTGGFDASPLIECIPTTDVKPIPEESATTEPYTLIGDPSTSRKPVDETEDRKIPVKTSDWHMREPSADEPDPWLSAYMTEEDIENCKKARLEKEAEDDTLNEAPWVHTEDIEPEEPKPIKLSKMQAQKMVLEAPWTSSIDTISTE